MVLRPDDCAVPALAQEELLDAQNPLRHLMHVDVDIADDVIEDTSPSKDYLSVLPRQSHSIKDEILSLTFQGNGKDQSPILISLYMDASPGCGGVAWPAGQVCILGISLPRRGVEPSKDPVKLHRQKGLTNISARQNYPRTRKRDWAGRSRSWQTRRKSVDNRSSASFYFFSPFRYRGISCWHGVLDHCSTSCAEMSR